MIAQILQSYGYGVEVLGCRFREEFEPLPPDGLPVVWEQGCNYPNFIKTSRKILKGIDGDLIYAVTSYPSSLGLAYLKKLFSNKPLLLDLEDGYGQDVNPHRNNWFPNSRRYHGWAQNLVEQADAITVGSKALEYGFGGTYIPRAVNGDLFNPELYDRDQLRTKFQVDHYRLLLCLESVSPEQGLEQLLTALEELDHKDIKLVLIAQDEASTAYIQQLRQRWAFWIFPLPMVREQDLPQLFAIADGILCTQNPNKPQQFNYLLEAMAMAKPIMASTTPETKALLRKHPQALFAIDDLSTIKEALHYTLGEDNPLGAWGRERFLDFYSWEKVGERLANIIDRL
jgi:glycosyltransferase involved in cell wall biosynthesis